jgi:hypothetical protein
MGLALLLLDYFILAWGGGLIAAMLRLDYASLVFNLTQFGFCCVLKTPHSLWKCSSNAIADKATKDRGQKASKKYSVCGSC